jgi:hypothetical protein
MSGKTSPPGIAAEEAVIPESVDPTEWYFEQGWTDGLPVVPATPAKVAAMLATAADREPTAVLGRYPERNRSITVEQVAVNAVMAGCRPEYFPVVLAAVEAVTDAAFGLHGASCTTSGVGILLVVNGPVGRRIGLNAGVGVFGHGFRANLTIGRTIRLLLVNVGGVTPGLVDRSTFGHPSKIAFCIAENEEASPWEPLHVELGFRPDQSTVTVFAAEGPQQSQNRFSTTADQILTSIAGTMSHPGVPNLIWQGQFVVVLGQEHAQAMREAGLSKKQVKQELWERARRPVEELVALGILAPETGRGVEGAWRTVTPSPDHITVLVAGGDAGRYSMCLPNLGYAGITQSVTREVRESRGGST